MTRVRNDDNQRRIEQQRQLDAQNRAKSQEGREKFAKALAQQKNETGQAKKEAEVHGGRAVKAQLAQQAMMARAGVVNQAKFAQMLGNSGQQSIRQGEQQTKSRTDDLKENEIRGREDKAEVQRKEMGEADKLAAIDGERRGSSGGGGLGGGASGGDTPGGGGPGARAEGVVASQAQHSQQAQGAAGAQVPRIPEAMLQELVKRVMVGVDAKGMGTFVVQLKNEVLGGTAIHINAKDGRIAAKFVTSDENTGRLIKASEGALARALARNGMSLERLEIETRA